MHDTQRHGRRANEDGAVFRNESGGGGGDPSPFSRPCVLLHLSSCHVRSTFLCDVLTSSCHGSCGFRSAFPSFFSTGVCIRELGLVVRGGRRESICVLVLLLLNVSVYCCLSSSFPFVRIVVTYRLTGFCL